MIVHFVAAAQADPGTLIALDGLGVAEQPSTRIYQNHIAEVRPT